MQKHLLLLLGLLILSGSTIAQNIRSYDGTGNNLQNPDWGATHTQLNRLTTIAYSDGISTPGGITRPNPRLISNALFAQDTLIPDPLNLSDFIWVFGQFIDHDITLVEESGEPAFVPVPVGDPWFDPFGQGTALIFMTRSAPMPGTGTTLANPREHGNVITAWIDGSAVYGSDQQRADWLRTFAGGKMKTSTANLLPFNTFTGNYATPVDPNSPDMADPVQNSNYHFVAGDIRANENPLLIAFHTLFVREHNRLCDTLAVLHPTWTDEELYQHARKWVGGLIQNVVYSEWLPTMGIDVPAYTGYDAMVNPNITNIFSGSAFRMGHTLLNSVILRLDDDGNEIPAGNLLLQDAFFHPTSIIWSGQGIDPLFRGMGTQVEQDLDCKMINDVRNFLFGPPGAGGLDLAAININRGRERGLPDFNTVRADFGMTPYNDFYELTADSTEAAFMEQIYGDIDDVDSWVGMLAEKHMPNALFGETIMEIMKHQFFALRDGDRFYFENDPMLSADEKTAIKNTTLHDIIMRNTNINLMQPNVFEVIPQEMICDPEFVFEDGNGNQMPPPITGHIVTEGLDNLENVQVWLDTFPTPSITDASGQFIHSAGLPENCVENILTFAKEEDYKNGVTTFDMVLIQKHILGNELLSSPYKMLAADVNQSGTITTFDMVEIRKLILGNIDEFDMSPSWRFLPADFVFDDPQNPLDEDLPVNEFGVMMHAPAEFSFDFIGIKIGDVNETAIPDFAPGADDRNGFSDQLIFQTKNQSLEVGQEVVVDLHLPEAVDLQGFQFTFDFDETALELVDFQAVNVFDFDEKNYLIFENKGAVTTSWNGNVSVEAGAKIFQIIFNAKTNGKLNEWLDINSQITKAEAYSQADEFFNIKMQFKNTDEEVLLGEFELFQNEPNPFSATTQIEFYLPAATEVQLTIFDGTGKAVKSLNQFFEKGYQQIPLNANEFSSAGIFYYQMQTAYGTLTKKMIIAQ